MKIPASFKFVSRTEEPLFGWQTETIEIYEVPIPYDRPITRSYVQVVTYSATSTTKAPTSRLFKSYCNYGFSHYDRPPYFNPNRRSKTPAIAYKEARIHLLGS